MSRGEGRRWGVYAPVLSDTLRYSNLVGLATDLVASRGPMHLCACVSEERGDGEGAGSQALSDTLRYINLAGLTTGLVHTGVQEAVHSHTDDRRVRGV